VAGVDKERLSIQGWFHFPQPGEPGYEPDQMRRLWTSGAVSTLSQIEAKRQRESGCVGEDFTMYPELISDAVDLSDEDRALLSKYINADYLSDKVMRQVADKFAEDSHIQLGAFLNRGTADVLEASLRQIDALDAMNGIDIPPHGTGERGRWHAFGPPVIRRFMRLDGPPMANTVEGDGHLAGKAGHETVADVEQRATELLSLLRDDLFASGAYARWLSRITTLAISGCRGMVRRFRSGLDYTLGTPDGTKTTTLDAVLCLADSPEKWVDGVVGGYQCFIDGGSEDDEASNDGSVYRSNEEDGVLLTTPAAWNTLNVVMREPGVVKFVKYVSASAPGSRWDVSYEYQVPASDDSEE
ncbi:putative component of NuA3 histone acetyltransferase complex, partial [Coemansia thaxteri]